MSAPRIAAFAGSTRTGSWNGTLLKLAATAAREAGAEVTEIDLRDYPLPIFSQDLEADEGAPASAVALKELLTKHDGLLIASPEYNTSITPLLKNTIDWVSRPDDHHPGGAAFKDKVAGLMSASPGRFGGVLSQTHLRSILTAIGIVVVPGLVTVPEAASAFDDEGRLTDDRTRASVERLGRRVVELIRGRPAGL